MREVTVTRTITHQKMDQKHKKILRKNRPKLEEDLQVDDIWAQLISYEVFVPADYGEMFNPNRKPMATMLDKLEQKGRTAFQLFVKAVSESGKAHLLDCLNDKESSQENDEPEKLNEELVGNNTGFEFTVKKEFQDEPDLNVSDPPRSCTGDCAKKIRQLQGMLKIFEKENAHLKIKNDQIMKMNRATEATRAKQETDNRIKTCLLWEKNRMLMEQNEHFYNGQNLLFYQNRQLLGGNTSLTNELQQMKSTRKRSFNYDANDSNCNPKKKKDT
ncbi:uncharacterized protein LOC117121361 isoform X2 [Anneissia japonica]|uniref:uncharacterized protein LOC117121361 isoform X2 n=1 Tax=Anneissia japonica TaxID=1529436 RepID=UPI0014254B47|nr:uncharacterized protein LOC117121361 isoform X2 [Anneissia japonica]